jgi:hypothetical protein
MISHKKKKSSNIIDTMNKGKLIYISPSNDILKVIYAVSVSILGIIPLIVILIIVVINYGKLDLNLNFEDFLGIGFFIMISILGFIHGDSVLNPHYRIYSNGITVPRSPYCTFLKVKERFIPFSQIMAFETDTSGRKGYCVIYFKPKKSIEFSHDLIVLKHLSKILQKQSVKKVSYYCSNCRKLIWGDYNCPYCKKSRW